MYIEDYVFVKVENINLGKKNILFFSNLLKSVVKVYFGLLS